MDSDHNSIIRIIDYMEHTYGLIVDQRGENGKIDLIVDNIIHKDEKVPVSCTRTYYTQEDNTTKICIPIIESNSTSDIDHIELGSTPGEYIFPDSSLDMKRCNQLILDIPAGVRLPANTKIIVELRMDELGYICLQASESEFGISQSIGFQTLYASFDPSVPDQSLDNSTNKFTHLVTNIRVHRAQPSKPRTLPAKIRRDNVATAYGIDLGTTYSAIAKLSATGAPEMIEDNDYGSDIIATAVYFAEDGSVMVGDPAKEEGVVAPERLMQFFKRWIGCGDDETRERYIVDGKEYDPIELATIVLGRIINYAKDSGEDVKDVVITCPAYFPNVQRDAMRQACIAAGLNVLAVINELIAAAINYCVNRFNQNQNILVYDLGGGSFDVTLMRMSQDGNGRNVDVLGTNGDAFLGGCDWDEELYKLFLQKYEENYGIAEDAMPEELKSLIRGDVEKQKIKLTLKESTKMKIPYDGETVILEVTREEFENATAGYLEQTVGWLDSVLEKANMTDNDVDVVLMVGGSTRMPMVRNMLTTRFDEKVFFGDPDRAVVKGAAIIAHFLQNGSWPSGLGEDNYPSSRSGPNKPKGFPQEYLLKKLQEQIEQGSAHLVYGSTSKRVEIIYNNDNGKEELFSIFEELRRQRDLLLDESGKAKRLLDDVAGLLSNADSILQLQASIKKIAFLRKSISSLIEHRLEDNITEISLNVKMLKDLDERLSDILYQHKKVEQIIDGLKENTHRITSNNFEDFIYVFESDLRSNGKETSEETRLAELDRILNDIKYEVDSSF